MSLVHNPLESKDLRHIEATGCKYINRKQFDHYDISDRGSPTNPLTLAKVDDPIFLSRILLNTTKIETLIYSGDISFTLLGNLNSFSDRIETLVAQDMSIFHFE